MSRDRVSSGPASAGLVLLLMAEGFSATTFMWLPDDVKTMGNWYGRYGYTSYLIYSTTLCVFPGFLSGGERSDEIYFQPGKNLIYDAFTVEHPVTTYDERVLYDRLTGWRWGAVWDDGSEALPPGSEGMLGVSFRLPEGLYRCSLYFYEITWPQFRCLRLIVREGGRQGPILGEKLIEDF